MKFKILTFIFFCGFLYSEDLYFYKYLKEIENRNLDIEIQKKQLEKVDLLIQQKKSFFKEPWRLEFQYTNGNIKSPYNVLYNQFPGNSFIKQYVIGVNKVIDLLNQQKTQRELYEIQKEIEKKYLSLIKQEWIYKFRNSYFRVIFLNQVKEHLKEHIDRFQKMKYRFKNNYFDKKLGYYTYYALEMGITTLQNDYSEVQKQIQEEITILNTILNIPNYDSDYDHKEEIKFDTYQIISNILPDEQFVFHCIEEYKSPLIQIENLKLKIKEKDIEIYKKIAYQDFEIFLYFNKKEQGKYKDPSFDTIIPQKENLWTLGIRIPIPYASERDYEYKIKNKEKEIQNLNLEKLQNHIRNSIQLYYENYKIHYKQFQKNQEFLKKNYVYLEMLEESLLKRRITYFEFWGEHEKFHNLLLMTLHNFIQALENIGNLEYYTGKEILKIP